MARMLTDMETAFIEKQLLTIMKIANNKNIRSVQSRVDQMNLLATLAVNVIEATRLKEPDLIEGLFDE